MTTNIMPIKVFYSYANEDESLRKALETHLSLLRRQGVIQEWHDRRITPGQEWGKAIDQNLEAADLILLLVSADFLASDYCYKVELRRAMERHERGEAQVIPVILRKVDWSGAPFGKLQCLPTNARPVIHWPDQDEAFADIAQGIRQAVAGIQAAPGPRPAAAELRRRYLYLMQEEWNTLRLQALDSAAGDTRTRPVALGQVYVNLDTQSPRPKSLYHRDKADPEQPPLTAVEALCHAEQRRLVLLGQPGSGKSTFARYLSLALAESMLGAEVVSLSMRLPEWSGPVLLPVMVPLGRLAAGLKGDSAEDVAASIQAFIATNRDLQRYGPALLQELQQDGGLVIFDGLDEVLGARRAQVKAALNRFTAVYTQCRVMVTCRTHSYQQDEGWQLAWPVYELALFSNTKINAFIAGWYGALGRRDPGRETSYQQKASTLQAALAPDDPRGLLELARTPLLLTVMAIVHAHKELPGSRVAVYRECVELLLLRWQKSRAEEGGRQGLLETLAAYGVTERQLEQGLCEVAYRAHEIGETHRLGGGGRALVSEDILRGILYRWFQRNEAAVADFLDYCQDANSLLLAQGTVATVTDDAPEVVYAFPHLSFEEYLAARHLRRLRLSGSSFTRHAAELAGEPNWREVVRFLGEYLCHDKEGGDIVYAQDLLTRLCPVRQPVNDADWRCIWLAGILLPGWLREVSEEERDPALQRRIIERLADLLETSTTLRYDPRALVEAGRALAGLGDPRRGVEVRIIKETSLPVPDIRWEPILAGPFIMGSGEDDDQAGEGEKPAHELTLPTFLISRYPITNAQYRPFVDAKGYEQRQWWTEAGWDWRQGAAANLSAIDTEAIKESLTKRLAWRPVEKRNRPFFLDNPQWNIPTGPVIGVSWYEALAYCRWLEARLRDANELPAEDGTLCLPSEAQWEKAARGLNGNHWPWGNDWREGCANTAEAGLQEISPVGIFPEGASPYGVQDMAGNVWEWTRSVWGRTKITYPDYGYPYNSSDGREALKALQDSDLLVVRGGAFGMYQEYARCAVRHGRHPSDFNGVGGFRVVWHSDEC